jgi:hypothetical protein
VGVQLGVREDRGEEIFAALFNGTKKTGGSNEIRDDDTLVVVLFGRWPWRGSVWHPLTCVESGEEWLTCALLLSDRLAIVLIDQ